MSMSGALRRGSATHLWTVNRAVDISSSLTFPRALRGITGLLSDYFADSGEVALLRETELRCGPPQIRLNTTRRVPRSDRASLSLTRTCSLPRVREWSLRRQKRQESWCAASVSAAASAATQPLERTDAHKRSQIHRERREQQHGLAVGRCPRPRNRYVSHCTGMYEKGAEMNQGASGGIGLVTALLFLSQSPRR